MNNDIRSAILANTRMFMKGSASFLVDGQFGSTGKGLLAGLYAEMFADRVDLVASNAGPNSGHTSYFRGEKIVLRQLPTFSVTAARMGHRIATYLDAGAVLDLEVLENECLKYEVFPQVSPWAAVIKDHHKSAEATLVNTSGSTGKGIGAAIADKVMRRGNVVGHDDTLQYPFIFVQPLDMNQLCYMGTSVFVEVSQGFSLGINSGFYPNCTSRECTASQAMADLGLNPRFYGTTSMVMRTYPIRIAGDSGPGYSDQQEITWDQLGVAPEYTTVTNKIRRVFEWSDMQAEQAISANRPDVILLNFCNYLKSMGEVDALANRLNGIYRGVMGHDIPVLLLGFGPNSEDVRLWK